VLRDIYERNAVPGQYSPDAGAAGKRALRGRALGLLSALDPDAGLARAQFETAGNMTERMDALSLLVGAGRADEALAEFYETWADDRLVIDKWFAVQASRFPPESAAAQVAALSRHEDFDWQNPNRFRSLIGAFAMGNPAGFHAADGSGYELLAGWLIRLDPLNPQTAARLSAAFSSWRIFDADRQALIGGQLERIAARPGLSRDTGEMVGRLLGDGT